MRPRIATTATGGCACRRATPATRATERSCELVPAQTAPTAARGGDALGARSTRRIGRPGEPDADFAAVVWRHRLPVDFPEASRSRGARDRAGARGGGAASGSTCARVPFVTIDPETRATSTTRCSPRSLPDGGAAPVRRGGRRLALRARRLGRSIARRCDAATASTSRTARSPCCRRGSPADLCSLRPDVDRLALVAELALRRARARLRSARFHAARIRSRARLSYAEAQAQLDGATGRRRRCCGPLASWASQRARERRRRGGLDFELPGVEIGFDATRKPERRATSGAQRRAPPDRGGDAGGESRRRGVAVPGRRSPVPYRNHLAARSGRHRAAGGASARAAASPASCRPARCPRACSRVRSSTRPRIRSPSYTRWCCAICARRATAPPRSATTRWRCATTCTSRRRSGATRISWCTAPSRRGSRASTAHPRFARGPARRRARLVPRAARAAGGARDGESRRCAFLRDHVGEEHEGTISGLGRMGLFVTLEPWPIDGLVPASRLGVGRAGRARARAGRRGRPALPTRRAGSGAHRGGRRGARARRPRADRRRRRSRGPAARAARSVASAKRRGGGEAAGRAEEQQGGCDVVEQTDLPLPGAQREDRAEQPESDRAEHARHLGGDEGARAGPGRRAAGQDGDAGERRAPRR